MSLSVYEQQRLYTRAAELLQQGYSQPQIIAELEQAGVSGNEAQTILDRLIAADQSVQSLQPPDKVKNKATFQMSATHYQASRQSDQNAALQAMAGGAIICIIGIVVTVGTYSAVSKGGGSYVIAYGAIIAGGVQFFRGLYAYMNS